MNAMKSAREFWLEKEVARLSRDRGMLKAVHGALVDAGCRMGEIGHCEADLVRELTQERDDLLRRLPRQQDPK